MVANQGRVKLLVALLPSHHPCWSHSEHCMVYFKSKHAEPLSRVELETLDFLTMVHHAIADRVDELNELRQGTCLLWQSTS